MSPNCKCISLICVALSMLTAGCSHTYRVGDYTLLSTKNVNLDSGNRARSYMTVIDLLHNLTYIKNYKNSVI